MKKARLSHPQYDFVLSSILRIFEESGGGELSVERALRELNRPKLTPPVGFEEFMDVLLILESEGVLQLCGLENRFSGSGKIVFA